MIKINLLPLEDRKKSRRFSLPSLPISGAKTIWVVFGVLVYAGMVFAIGTLQSRNVRELEAKIEEARKESVALRPQLEKIQRLTKEREEVNRRLGIIATLDKNRYIRVKVLNDISENLPSNCWLTSLKEHSGTMLSIEGVTFSNYVIADFMNNLEKAGMFQDVTLSIAQEGQIIDHNVIQFTVESNVAPR